MAVPDVPYYSITIEGETCTIGTAAELAVALDVLQGQYDRAVLTQLRPHLAQIIGGPVGLLSVLRSLAPDDQAYLIEALGSRLTDCVRAAHHLRDILAMLSESRVEETLLNALGGAGLRALILTAQELAEVLEWVYGACDQLVLDLLGTPYLQALFSDGRELSLVLSALESAAQAGLLERLGWERVVRLAHGARDLAYLMRTLPEANGRLLLSHFTRPQLLPMVRNPRDWEYLYRRLEPAEATYLMTLLGVNHAA